MRNELVPLQAKFRPVSEMKILLAGEWSDDSSRRGYYVPFLTSLFYFIALKKKP